MARRKLKTICIWDYTVMLTPLKRKSIYGERKITAKNADGSVCEKAYLSENGTELYPKGATSVCKTDRDGNAYTAGKILQDEEETHKGEYASRSEMERDYFSAFLESRKISEQELNTFIPFVTGIYTLEDFDQAALAETIGDEIYHYNLKTDKDKVKKSLVFQRSGRVFLLTYETGYANPAKRTAPPQLDDSPLNAKLDDIDFEMF